MIGLLFGLLGIVFLILFIVPLKIIIKALIRRDKKLTQIENALLKRRKAEQAVDLADAKKDKNRTGAIQIQAKYRLFATKTKTIQKSRHAMLSCLNFVVNVTSLIASGSTMLIVSMAGLLVVTALLMSTQIPSWSIITDYQNGGTASAKTESNSDSDTDTEKKSSGKSDSDGIKKGEPTGGNPAVKAFIYLLNSGMSEEWAAGIIGNWMQESAGGTYNLSTTVSNGSTIGIAQWLGPRRTRLEKIPHYTDLKVQVNFALTEMKENGNLKYIKSHPKITPPDASYWVVVNYERAPGQRDDLRMKYATKFYNAYVKNDKYKKYVK